MQELLEIRGYDDRDPQRKAARGRQGCRVLRVFSGLRTMCCARAFRGSRTSSPSPGIINRDFADVKTTMAGMGYAVMGTAVAQRDSNRAIEAAHCGDGFPITRRRRDRRCARHSHQHQLVRARLKLSEVNEASTHDPECGPRGRQHHLRRSAWTRRWATRSRSPSSPPASARTRCRRCAANVCSPSPPCRRRARNSPAAAATRSPSSEFRCRHRLPLPFRSLPRRASRASLRSPRSRLPPSRLRSKTRSSPSAPPSSTTTSSAAPGMLLDPCSCFGPNSRAQRHR